MKAIVLYAKGPADNLQIADVPQPEPGATDVLVDVSFAGVNHGDVIRRERGLFPAGSRPPFILGLEGAGVVARLGDDVKGFRIGQRVAFLVESGGYSKMVRVPSGQVFAIPDGIPDAMAAASTCVGLTAWHLTRIASLQPEQNVLVHAGAGGVGSALIQACKLRSVKVITTVGSEEKAAFAASLGADDVIDYRRADFADTVQRVTMGRGVETIFDCVGHAVTEGNFKCLAKGGQILYYGSASGHAQFPGDKVLNGEARISGFVIFGLFRNPALWRQGVEGLMKWLQDGAVTTAVREMPMNEIVAAHKMLESRRVNGKLILNMA